MADTARTWSFLHRHPIIGAIGLLVGTVALTVGILEISLRFLIDYKIGYYMGVPNDPGVVEFPFGTVPFNSLRFPDAEFDLDDPRPRVGYVGDSVTFGVGAGYGYRMTEVLEEFYPDRQHMNLSWGLGTGMTPATASAVLANVEALGLDTLVYVLNLNDILPGQDDSPMTPSTFRRLKDRLASLDVLRGNSYLYTWVRNELKTLLLSYGIGAEGRSYELHPETYQDVIEDTAARVNRLGAELAKRGVDFVVVILPYEMQISAQAEHVYRDLGVRWGEGFIERHTQKLLAEHLSGVRLADAAGAFLDPRGERRADIEIGEYFVHDRGGRLDWNHPNRAGHRRIAEFLVDAGIFAQPMRAIEPDEDEVRQVEVPWGNDGGVPGARQRVARDAAAH